MKKGRILAALMSVIMVLSPVPGFAQEDQGKSCVYSEESETGEKTDTSEDEAFVLSDDGSAALVVECGAASKTYEFKYAQTESRKMLKRINDFRKSDDAWYWNEDNSAKVKASGLQDYIYDYGLEKVAMLRAIEIVEKWSHTRPNGNSCFTAWTDLGYSGNGYRGENIAYGYPTEEAVFMGWREDNDKFEGQGHRRNMLSSNFKYIGIGHVIYKGTHYWVQDFGSVPTNEAECAAADGDYKAVFDDKGNAAITELKSNTDDKPEDKQDDTPAVNVSDIVLVKNEKYDLADKLAGILGNVKIVKYKSDSKKIAAVSKKGIVTGKYNKTEVSANTVITAYTKNADGSLHEAAKVKVIVYKPVFCFENTDLTHPGMTVSANAYLANVPAGKSVKYSVPASGAAVMSINENSGLITAGDKNGSVKVTALIGEGDKAAKYTATLKVKKPKLKEGLKIKVGRSKKLTLKNVSSYNQDKLKWSVTGSAVSLEMTPKNKVVKISGLSAGEAVVSVTLDGVVYKTTVTVE
ncbi:MAG: CAP domain-containing protein [Lachnospiraceae bacterium]|nr:CAP domain-containing protein [Lachnospiraceae bacterium]